MTDRIRCPGCGMPTPDVPEDATHDEKLCNTCFDAWEAEMKHQITMAKLDRLIDEAQGK